MTDEPESCIKKKVGVIKRLWRNGFLPNAQILLKTQLAKTLMGKIPIADVHHAQ